MFALATHQQCSIWSKMDGGILEESIFLFKLHFNLLIILWAPRGMVLIWKLRTTSLFHCVGLRY